jgi:NAD(P)-dependent dehydrogenase (short-subunit alcohol dehydrogenase family)
VSTILITGANKGLGHETARRLLAAGHLVWMGARDEKRGRAAADELGGRLVALDVTNDQSVAAAVELIAADRGLDVLINKALALCTLWSTRRMTSSGREKLIFSTLALLRG